MAYILDLAASGASYWDCGWYNPGYYRQAQSFQFTTAPTITGAEVFIRTNAASASGDYTVTIETDNSNKPSGTLAHANGTATIASFTNQTYTWKTVSFTDFTLSANTKYWLVLKKASETGTNTTVRHSISDDTYANGGASEYDTNTSIWTTRTADQGVRISGTLAAAITGGYIFIQP